MEDIREFNGRMIEELCALGDAIAEAYGPAFRAQKQLEQKLRQDGERRTNDRDEH